MKHQAGVDYLTLTAPTSAPYVDRMYNAYIAISAEQVDLGNEPKDVSYLGYKGRAVGGAVWGEREDGVMLRLSGNAAAHRAAQALSMAHCTRIDLQVTTWLGADCVDYYIEAEAVRAMEYRKVAGKGRRWRLRHVNGMGAGDTLYLGSRSSERFGRIYDKGAESGEEYYQGAVRHEIEYKGISADTIWREEAHRLGDPGRVTSLVRGAFERWGLDLAFPGTAEAVPISALRAGSDNARRLRWLTDQVAPTVQRLMDAGLEREVLTALGFFDILSVPGAD